MMEERVKTFNEDWNQKATNIEQAVAERKVEMEQHIEYHKENIQDTIDELEANVTSLKEKLEESKEEMIKMQSKIEEWDKIDYGKLEVDVYNVGEKIKKLQEGTEARNAGKEKEKQSLTTKRHFSSLPPYGGKHEDYEDWRFKMKTFVSED